MGKQETAISNRIQLELSSVKTPPIKKVVTFRNNRGVAIYTNEKTGKKRRVRYGVGPNGADDLIGYTVKEITPGMVGSKVAIFTAIEVKTPEGSATKEQRGFNERIRRDGGIAGFARSPEEAVEIVSGSECEI